MTNFVEQFRDRDSKLSDEVLSGQRKPRQRSRFIKGPIPEDLIAQATQISKSAGIVMLALFYQSGLRKRNTVPVPYKALRRWGVSDNTTRNAIKKLVAAGLITNERRAGHSPRVTIMEREK
jgi:hypothetical protein